MFTSASRLQGVNKIISGKVVPIANVIVLMKFDGTDGSNSFVDERGNAMTAVASATLTTADYVFPPSSGNFPAGGSYVKSAAAIPGLAFGTGNFCIEGRAKFNAIGGGGSTKGIFQISPTVGGLQSNQSGNLALDSRNSDTKWEIYANNTTNVGTLSPTTGQWYHWCVQRISGVTKLFINGVAVITVTDTTNYTGTYLAVGGIFTATNVMNGYIDELRICNTDVYPATGFTVPTSPFPTS